MRHGRAHSRHLLRTWLIHVAVFAVGQTLLAVYGHSWLLELVGGADAAEGWITLVGRFWVFAFLIDTAIVAYRQVAPKEAPV